MKTRKNSDIVQVREYFGINQMQLAIFLEMSRNHLSMVENRKRKLPTAAVEKLNELLQEMNLPAKPLKTDPGTHHKNELAIRAKNEIKKIRIDLKIAEIKLSKLEEQLKRSLMNKGNSAKLLRLGKKHKILEIVHFRTQAKAANISKLYFNLQLRIAGLKGKLQWLENLS